MTPEPGEVAGLRLGAGDDQVTVLGKTGDGEVRLDAAALVQPLGIDDPAGSDIDVIGRDAVQHRQRIASLENEFGEGGLVEQADRVPYRFGFDCSIGEPVLPPIGIAIFRLDTGWSEPVRT